MKLWDVAGGDELATLLGQLVGFTSLAFSPDGKRLAAGGWDGRITLWDLASRQQVGQWKAHDRWCSFIRFASGDELLVSGGTIGDRYVLRAWPAPALARLDAGAERRVRE